MSPQKNFSEDYLSRLVGTAIQSMLPLEEVPRFIRIIYNRHEVTFRPWQDHDGEIYHLNVTPKDDPGMVLAFFATTSRVDSWAILQQQAAAWCNSLGLPFGKNEV
jgi:hypothetical protein